MNDTFYHDLPVFKTFREAVGEHFHADLPPDWWVVIADIEKSTRAIESGNYKNVNTVGVACIAAVTNVNRSIEIPFVFGGDGATFAIPDSIREEVMSALRGTQRLAKNNFDLVLRAGLVRVADLRALKKHIRVAKVRLSPNALQTALSGDGWSEAERLVKAQNSTNVIYVNAETGKAQADFAGFSCRWQSVPSFSDHKLSLLIAARTTNAAERIATYERVLARIQAIYGEVDNYHPLHSKALQMSFNPNSLSHEWRVKTAHLANWQRFVFAVQLLLQSIAGYLMFKLNLNTRLEKWRHYRENLVENSDFRKFDGMLRMVIDGSEAQAKAIENYLAQERKNGQLVYGLHKSPSALVTCLVHSYKDNHLHFVDGSEGGYALAALKLKEQLKQ